MIAAYDKVLLKIVCLSLTDDMYYEKIHALRKQGVDVSKYIKVKLLIEEIYNDYRAN